MGTAAAASKTPHNFSKSLEENLKQKRKYEFSKKD